MNMGAICQEVRNYFLKDYINPKNYIYSDTYTIFNGVLSPSDFITDGQYIRICGSTLNDGVWKYSSAGNSEWLDETFKGNIWLMYVPRDFIELCDEISDWVDNYGKSATNLGPLTSESFGGYSYSKGTTGSLSGSGTATTWQAQFNDALNRYRRVYIL